MISRDWQAAGGRVEAPFLRVTGFLRPGVSPVGPRRPTPPSPPASLANANDINRLIETRESFPSGIAKTGRYTQRNVMAARGNRPCRVLVVDDEEAIREVLRVRLEKWGCHVDTVSGVGAADAFFARQDADVVVCDLVMPDGTGLDVLQRHQRAHRLFIVVTAYGTVDTAVAAMKGGAAEFLTKPIDYVQLRGLITAHSGRTEGLPEAATTPPNGLLVGTSPAIEAVRQQIVAVGPSTASVMIVGESGTGKELVARSVVASSRRHATPFVAINAAAISSQLIEAELFGYDRGAFTGAVQAQAGIFEQADQGTLFLDEVTEMPVALQPKLLRVLEDGVVRRLGSTTTRSCDVRIIAATNRPPDRAVAEGRFRRDLLHRLCVFRIDLPPLRERREDIPLLATHLLRALAQREGRPSPSPLTSGALDRLCAHAYPGNVRELKNLLERAAILAGDGPIEASHVPAPTSPDPAGGPGPASDGITLPAQVTAAEAERILIVETLKRTNNNKSEVARRLGLDVKTVRKKLKAFDLDR